MNANQNVAGQENIFIAVTPDGDQIKDITARAGVFSEEEVTCVAEIWDDYIENGVETCGYNFAKGLRYWVLLATVTVI